eukprot:g4447.t1
MGTTTFPSDLGPPFSPEVQNLERSAGLPAPCFSDVLEAKCWGLAQRWAVQVVRQAETEACRRGMRGSPAWEDAWRDALWTLAVQKRCVEVEAREQVLLERRCLEMRERLDLLEERLELLSRQLEGLDAADAPWRERSTSRRPRGASPPGSGPLPAGLASPSPPRAPELSGLSFILDEREERQQRQQRREEELQRQESLRSSEAKLEESYRQLEESESTWRQRHSALQRQLQRTERQLSTRVLHLARPKRQVPRPESSGLPDLAQWALTVGLGTLLPGFALFKLFTATGAVEAERGAQEAWL